MISQTCFDKYRAADFVDGGCTLGMFFPFTDGLANFLIPIVCLCYLSRWENVILAWEIVPPVVGYRLNIFRGVFAYALSREFYKEIRGHTGRSEMNNFFHEHF